MSSINPEMLKQLLAEFEEKQAVCAEEINAIEDQIKELEKRIESSRDRLVSIVRDREKVGQMKKRYAEGDWSSVLAQINEQKNNDGNHRTEVAQAAQAMARVIESPPPESPPLEIAPPVPAQAPAPAPAPQPQVEALQAAPQPPQFEQPSWESPQPFQPQPPAQQPTAPPQQQQQQGEGLFPFSGQVQETPAAPPAQSGDVPWAAPTSMTWESVGSHAFPPQGPGGTAEAQMQQQAYQPKTSLEPFPQTPPAPPQAADTGQPNATASGNFPPQQAPQGATPSQAVLTTAFDEEFDISDALRSEDDNTKGESRENDKKIKDALRGLFS